MLNVNESLPYLFVLITALVPILSFRSYNQSWSQTTPWPALNHNRQTQYVNNSLIPVPTWVRARPVNNINNNLGDSTRQNGFSAGSFISGNQSRSFDAENVSDDQLREFSESLLTKDVNNAAKYVTVNYQGKTTSRLTNDEAPLALLTINSQVYNLPTIKKLLPLYDNYILEANVNEDYTAQERNEENELIDAIISTSVMQHTRNFLIEKGKITSNPQSFKNLLKEIWFNMYSRGKKKLGSSGFEHVFLAEIKNNQVSGLHNWLYFHEEENRQRANYLGYMKKIEVANKGAIIKFHFTFNGIDKPVASMFIGFSPELEMALYTVCFMMRADHICPLKLDNKRFIIRTYAYNYQNKKLIGSAFPEI